MKVTYVEQVLNQLDTLFVKNNNIYIDYIQTFWLSLNEKIDNQSDSI